MRRFLLVLASLLLVPMAALAHQGDGRLPVTGRDPGGLTGRAAAGGPLSLAFDPGDLRLAEAGPAAGASLATGLAGPIPARTATAPPVLDDDGRALLAEVLRDELRPLRDEIAAQRQPSGLWPFLAGLSVATGLAGIALLVMARQRARG